MMLNLQRPIIFFDLETTGTSVTTDRIVEISLLKVDVDGATTPYTFRVNPERPMPKEAFDVHHISDADLEGCPTFREIAPRLAELLEGCDLAGFNSNRFDIPMLDQEMMRAGVKFDFRKARFIDVQTIYHKREPRTLVAAYRHYCGRDLTEAHSAMADTQATYEVLLAQLEQYDDLPRDVAGLSDYSSQNRNVDLMGRLILNDQGREVINFGKYKGRIAEELLQQEPGFFKWVMQGDFPENTKDCFRKIQFRITNRPRTAN